MAERIRAFDWSRTPLGALSDWPQSLRTAVGMLVAAPNPMVLLWGFEGVLIYNDGYARFAGRRHPDLLGMGAREGWPEIADFNDGNIRRGLSGESWSLRDQELVLDRAGTPEPGWMDLDYVPVPDETGKPAGVMVFVTETTERVIAETRRTEADTRLQLALSAGRGIGAWDWDIKADLVRADERFARLYGVDPSRAAVGAPIAEFFSGIHPDDLSEVQAGIAKALSTGGVFSGEYRLLHPDGEIRWLQAEGRVELDADGAPARFPGVSFDISDRKAVESRLRFLDALQVEVARLTNAEQILATTTRLTGEFLGASICAYADMDADQDGFTIRGDWAAPGSSTIVGHYSLADFGQLAVQELAAGRPLIINDNLKELAPEEAATFQSIGVSATICMPLVKDGVLTALMAIHHKSPHVWTEDELATIRQVVERSWAHVERVRSEADRRESETRYEALFNAIDEGFCIIEFFDGPHGPLSDYIHVEANEAYALNAGIPDVVGQKVREMVGDEADEWVRRYRGVLTSGQPIRFEKELEKTGRWLELAAFRIEPASRKQVAVLFKDLTARKQAEQSLKGLNETLEQRVEERSAELMRAEEALRQSQKMEAVGQLTGGIAHDFNNLLAGISGSLELLQRRLHEGRLSGVERYIDAAQDASQRAASLTQRLLAFSRRQTLDPKPVSVNRLIGGMEELIRRTMGPDIEVEVVGAAGLWTTRVDPSQLENALLNLCINARDAMAPHPGRLTIETANKWLDDRAAKERELIPGQYISLCVTDTGSGIPTDIVDKIFDPFFTTKPIGQGTGLGLSMIHGFLRQSGGQVRVYSEPDKGTTMCLYLPRYTGDLDTVDPLDPVLEGHPGHGETVLLIDDEPTVRMLAAEVLGDAGYTVIEAVDGPSGLQILNSGARIDLLVTDVGLPGGLNGRQVADAARVGRPDLKVLFITGYAENAAVGNGLLDVGMAVLTKPFVMTDLINKVGELIDG
ncbi:ATP-binding protein [Brevundimonas sp. GCM10030266]|uniref:ATP-binding protein n=1 Tax=Brevundimonas sp. GCM10030266 TaxID=3273386 RepID=UPI0036190833